MDLQNRRGSPEWLSSPHGNDRALQQLRGQGSSRPKLTSPGSQTPSRRIHILRGEAGLGISPADLGPETLFALLNLTEAQRAILEDVFDRWAHSFGSQEGLDSLIRAIEDNRGLHPVSKKSLLRRLEGLRRSKLFRGGRLAIGDLIDPGSVLIVDLSDVSLEDQEKELVVAWISNKILRYRCELPNGSPAFLVVEDAEYFIPEDGGRTALSAHALERLARMGRKMKAGVILVGQRPSLINREILLSAANAILHRLSPLEFKAFARIFPTLDWGIEREITKLPLGEAFLVGQAVLTPLRFRVRALGGA
ncbi:MAG TPA: ATP-binding protein [Candidatus Korarchaeota archaeon]|nr:ATP-binding protein [Candidatus Korarchaeota archaeon]